MDSRLPRRRQRSSDSGVAMIEYVVLVSGLAGVLFSTHPPFGVKVARPACVAALVIDYSGIDEDHFCKDTTVWDSYGLAAPYTYVPPSVLERDEQICTINCVEHGLEGGSNG